MIANCRQLVHNQAMRSIRVVLGDMALLPRVVLLVASGAGLAGAIVGFLVGLAVNPPTAPIAAIELGLPATIAGAAVGLLTGLMILAIRRIRHRPA